MQVFDASLKLFAMRSGLTIDTIVLHGSQGYDLPTTLKWMADPTHLKSMHYVIDLDGRVFKCVDEEFMAFHSGDSSLHGRNNVDEFSIGICLIDSDEEGGFTEAQAGALLKLCAELCRDYSIPLNRVVGHKHISDKHADPADDFPWYEFLNTLGTIVVSLDGEMIARNN